MREKERERERERETERETETETEIEIEKLERQRHRKLRDIYHEILKLFSLVLCYLHQSGAPRHSSVQLVRSITQPQDDVVSPVVVKKNS